MKNSLLIFLAILSLSNCDMQSNKQTNYLIISNSNGHNLLKFDLANGQYVGVFNAEANNQLNFPDGITKLDEKRLIVSVGCQTADDAPCDKESSALLLYDTETGEFQGTFTSAKSSHLFHRPYGTAVGRDGEVAVASFFSNAILKYDQAGHLLDTLARTTTFDSLGFNGPNGLAFNPEMTKLFVTTEGASFTCKEEPDSPCILKFEGLPSLIRQINLLDHSSEVFAIPTILDPNNPPSLAGILFAPNGKIFVSDYTMKIIRVYDPTSKVEERTITINAEEICNGASIPAPYLGDMTLDQEGSIYVVIGSNTNASIGGVVKLSAPEYHTLTCVIPPNSNLKSPMGISVVN